MNVQIKMLFLFTVAILISSFSLGAVKYGEAVVKQGNLVVVREGRMYLFTTTNNPVTLYEDDTIRTLKNTTITFHNPDQHRMVLGSNAIMQLKKWQKREKQGTIRMLFGKFRARTAVLRKRSSLNIRTATVTIGIKGSLGESITNRNFTVLSNLGGEMSMTNNIGQETDIPLGQFGFNVDGKDQNIGLKGNPDFDPGKSEDDMETEKADELDTENTKRVDAPSTVKNIIVAKLKEPLVIPGEPAPKKVPKDDELGQDFLKDLLPDPTDPPPFVKPKIDVKIKFED